MKLCIYLHQDFHTGMQLLARYTHEMWMQHRPHIAPALSLCPCHGCVRMLLFLHEFHIAMATALPHFREFRFHPVLLIHLYLDDLAHQ